MWTGPAPMRPYNTLVHPRSWRAFMEYGNGIVGDMCVHMLDMVRWMLDLGMPTRIDSSGGILVDKASKANITDTQTATFDFPQPAGGLDAPDRTGSAPDPKYPWAATFYGDKGTLKAGVMGYDFIPSRQGTGPLHEDVTYELDQFPEDETEKELEQHVAPAIRAHMKNFLDAIQNREQAGLGHRAGIHVDDRVHPGESVDEARAVRHMGSRQRRRRERSGSQQAAAPSVPFTVGPPRPEDGLNTFHVLRATCYVQRATCNVLRTVPLVAL